MPVEKLSKAFANQSLTPLEVPDAVIEALRERGFKDHHGKEPNTGSLNAEGLPGRASTKAHII